MKTEPIQVLASLIAEPAGSAVPVTPLTKDELAPWLSGQSAAVRGWIEALGFKAEPAKTALIADPDGRLARVLVGVKDWSDPWGLAGLPGSLPAGTYSLDGSDLGSKAATQAALGWALGSYRFGKYKKADKPFAVLVWPEQADRRAVERTATATFLVRDLVNTPANDLGPAELAAAAKALADEFGAAYSEIVGEALRTHDYPMIYAVGQASPREPRLIDLRWGEETAPKVTLVGKGVCFDTGGLDIKPSSGMLTMKKDMGGAAHVLGVAQMVMMAELPVRLRVLIPAVENAVSGNSFRPLDVLRTRKGLTVEIGNTDAEGRLILADALTEAQSETPAIIVDFATLTGAARVALGPELPAMFCNDDATAAELESAAREVSDPLWRMPLWDGYRKDLDGKVADLNNVTTGGQGGAITAALFLEAFVEKSTPWVHLDTFAWNAKSRPGRPEGGEALGMRAVYRLIERRFG